MLQYVTSIYLLIFVVKKLIIDFYGGFWLRMLTMLNFLYCDLYTICLALTAFFAIGISLVSNLVVSY